MRTLLEQREHEILAPYAAFSDALQKSKKKLASINDSFTEDPEE